MKVIQFCRIAVIAASALFAAIPLASSAAQPWDHGRLKVDPTGRMLVHEDGHPFFWMGDSCWEFMHRSTREEVDSFSAHLRTEGCSAPVGIVALFADQAGRELGRRLVSPAVYGTTAKTHSIQACSPAETRFIILRLLSNDGGTGRAVFDAISIVASR